MRDARIHTGHLSAITISPRNRVGLSTNCDVDQEIFASLEYLSEIPSVGKKFIKELSKKDNAFAEERFSSFQAFIRQSKTFYTSAKTLHYRASPLNYYYSFLNLAKAYICLTDTDDLSRRIRHGLKHQFTEGDLKDQFISATFPDGIFSKFYHKLFETIPTGEIRLNIVTLLGYCTDIAHEFTTGGFGVNRTHTAKFNIAVNVNKAFGNLAISGFAHFDDETKRNIVQHFEEVRPNKAVVKEEFGIPASLQKNLNFFETIKLYDTEEKEGGKVDANEISVDCYQALRQVFMSNPYEDDRDFYICLPLTTNPYIPFNEITAIYIVMYYLGSLIRYYPRYLEKILASADAWIIERFAAGTPTTFLRHVSNLILNQDRIYRSR